MAKKAKVKSKLIGILEEFGEVKNKFYEKVDKEGFEEDIAKFWWDKISGQASYSFALSHCLPGQVKVNIDKNTTKTVKEIIEDDNIKELLTYNFKTNNYEKDFIEKKIDSGELELYRVETEDGRTIECSEGERFLTENGWKRLEELEEGEEIYVHD